jgi:ectoine hydroxylase-related dioxygenase (phytanoyl-CoA dioxygenase family)
MSKLVRPITRDEVAAYNLAGVVLLRGVLDLSTVNTLRRCIDEAVRTMQDSPSGRDLSLLARTVENRDKTALPANNDDRHNVAAVAGRIDGDQNGKGSFLLDTGIASRLREFRRFTLSGPGPEIAASMLGGDRVNFFGDQIFVKEPQTRERTAYHQDATYFEIVGNQCCVLWIPVDPVTMENGTMMYLRGSHRTGTLYRPNAFVSQAPLPGAQGEMIPDIEGHMDDYDVVHFDVEPGDIIVHHYRTIHGAGGNASRYQVRRAASIRYCGDDIRFQTRPGAPRQLHHTTRLTDGDPLGPPDFPIVWRRRQNREAA